MQPPTLTPLSKTAALRTLGVASESEQLRIAGMIDLVVLRDGHSISHADTGLPLVYVGLSGAIGVVGDPQRRVRAPFVLDLADRRLADSSSPDLVVQGEVQALMIDWRTRETVLKSIPHLELLLRDTRDRLEGI
ncbi:MAG: hypothetical protein AAF567_26330 [Actinomycetota bacterium]